MAARSTHVTLENLAGRFNLRRVSASLDHGEWAVQPPQILGDRAEWESESNGFATGTEGRVTYRIEDDQGGPVGELRLHWNNPFIGGNSYHESVAPASASPIDDGFSVVHVGGGGDNARVRFVLLKGFCSATSDGEIACSTASPLSAATDTERYAAIWTQSPGPSWHAVHGLSSARYQETFDLLVGQGFRPVDVCGYGVGGEDRYAAIFEQRDGPPLVARHGLSSDQYQQTFDDLVGQGFRPVKVSGYTAGGSERYAAIFEQHDGPPFAARHGLTSAQYQQTFDELVGQGFRPVHVNGCAVGGEDRYAAIFEQRDGPSFAARHGLTSAQYQQTFDELVRQGFRLTCVSGYAVRGEDRYAAIFEQQRGPAFAARHGLTSGQYQQAFDELLREGFRLVAVSGYTTG